MSNPPRGIIVDAYSTGNYLPAAFAALGVSVAHLQSTPELMPSMLPPARDSYTEFFTYDGEATVDELKRWEPRFVIAGQEPGVPFADRVSEALGLRTNGSRHSLARRDKRRMIETVAAAGLATARQLLTSDAAEAVAWAEAGGHWPCVAKPLSSASTDGVWVCRTPAELTAAVQSILGSADIFDIVNTQVLMQSYLEGVEYIVDTVSSDGEPYVCGIWRYEKRLLDNGKPIYNRDILVDPADPVCAQLIPYARDMLAALGIANGPAHSERVVRRIRSVLGRG